MDLPQIAWCLHMLLHNVCSLSEKNNDSSFQKNLSFQYIPILSPLRQYDYGTTDPSKLENISLFLCQSIEFADTAHIQKVNNNYILCF